MSQRIGTHPTNFWLFDPETRIIDLTRRSSSQSHHQNGKEREQEQEGGCISTLHTSTNTLLIDTTKTALVVIDMQNFFLEPALRSNINTKSDDGTIPSRGIQAANVLLQKGLPAVRKLGIQVVWVNWGLTEEDLVNMPPSIVKGFGPFGWYNEETKNPVIGDPRVRRGLGVDMGPITIRTKQNGKEEEVVVDGGRILMRDTWNSRLYPSLEEDYLRHSLSASGSNKTHPDDAESRLKNAAATREDVIIPKNRLSGLWNPSTPLNSYLQGYSPHPITTLLFAGVNTDQCVGGSLMDAFHQGYDCIMLSDAVATRSPDFASQCWEWNTERCFGFVSSCDALERALEEKSIKEGGIP